MLSLITQNLLCTLVINLDPWVAPLAAIAHIVEFGFKVVIHGVHKFFSLLKLLVVLQDLELVSL
jgi:hypothetical protein